jgi:nucleotide-binding universal stress UspA family protein
MKETWVVGYDGRVESERALEYAISEAPEGAEIVVVVVAGLPYEPMDPYEPWAPGVGLIPPIPPEGPVEIQPIIAEARRRLEAAGIEAAVDWGLGDAATEILRVAEERHANAIVVGTHHHSALGRFFGTDVAADIVKEAKCDVLVARE